MLGDPDATRLVSSLGSLGTSRNPLYVASLPIRITPLQFQFDFHKYKDSFLGRDQQDKVQVHKNIFPINSKNI